MTTRQKPATPKRWAFFTAGALLVGVISYFVVRDETLAGRMSHRFDTLTDKLDNPFLASKFDSLKYRMMLPNDLKNYMDDVFKDTAKWTETLDFKVGRELAAAGASPEYPVVLLPGLVSTGLESWTTTEKEGEYFRKRLWGSMSMVQAALFDKENWVHHLMLDPKTGLDPKGVRVRPAQGLDAASYFAAGYWVWSKIIENLAAVGYDINSITLAAYDWRLSMHNLEARDRFFTRLQNTFELNTRLYGKKSVLVTHSMGGTVMFYFLKWVEHEAGPQWIEKHIESVVSISGTFLGVSKAVPAFLSGEMRDTVQIPQVLSYLLERFFSSQERAALFRTWAGSASLIIKGGDAIWGNSTFAPDDTVNATETYGNLLNYVPMETTKEFSPNVTDAQRHVTASAMSEWLMQHTEEDFKRMLESNYTLGFERDESKIRSNDKNSITWTNPLEVALPRAPSLKLYCLYGWGKPTERAYYMRDGTSQDVRDEREANREVRNATLTESKSTGKPQQISRIDTRVMAEDHTPVTNAGVMMGEGDGTVPLISLGAMCAHGWKLKRYNPAGIQVITHELLHDPEGFDLRGGGSSGDHIDILGSNQLNSAIVKIATGRGHEVQDNYYSNIREYAERIDW